MAAQTLLITEAKPKSGEIDSLAAAWKEMSFPGRPTDRAVYVACDASTVLEIVALQNLQAVAALSTQWAAAWRALQPHLASDFNRQVLEIVDTPKDCATPLPDTPYLQLRHIEVLPSTHEDYLAWRDRTIYDVVRSSSEVDVFLAYHSAISTEPGVMFLSGFACDVDAYNKVFNSPRYQQIARDAGAQFITGGEAGLYTKVYRRLSA